MRRTALLLLIAGVLVVSGCTGASPGATPGDEATPSPTRSPTPADTATAVDTEIPTDALTPSATPPQENVTVEYAVSAGEIPAEFRSVHLTVQAVFVETEMDATGNGCWRETFRGPFKPTPTPIAMPEGDCYRSDPVTVNITAIEGQQSIGPFTALGRFDEGHALIVTNVTATHQNGTAITRIQDRSGHRAAIVEGPPNGSLEVSFGIHAWEDPPASGGDYYALVSNSSAGTEEDLQ